ncbi:type VI secretion system-associated protein TagF [Mesorhizobium sp. BR1-1-7]|uniref:type VI secretion system-associated protein TagF n=1 Tax=Mesorhizobium sp. BR1-1-7 TaxID=2876647 RepID=UPI001CCDBF63|nr:type VI secretion system-associated protein TagF [Mesorhizobium sp. BR1-1-7]MBZ9921861.1 type VI secretion system-associated protein TagF [Mesorhizobium sp. BR1-1-7]
MSTADITIGFFGKIPATGDFVAWNLPRSFIDRWDRWMSIELLARPDDGEVLDNRVWRFVVQDAIFGDQPCAGAWRMSQDRIGRRYPFVVTRLGATPDASDPWFEGMARIATLTVEQYWEQERIAITLQALDPPTSFSTVKRIAFWTDDWEVQEFVFADIHDLADNALPAMRAARAMPRGF